MLGEETADSAMPDLFSAGSNVTFGLGRGHQIAPKCYGRGRPVAPGIGAHTVDQSVMHSPLMPAASSTPAALEHQTHTQAVTSDMLSSLITDLAKQIGENITSSLNSMHQPAPTQSQSPQNVPSSCIDQSQLKVVVQSETKAPPYFKGDNTDHFPISEWEDMMRCYLHRISCDTDEEMFAILMSRLTGKARDVVKVSLRCRPELNGNDLITSVFDILRSNFSDLTYSSLPMKDFYSTVPRPGENAMDYWIRLNKSIDAADECLRRRGKLVEDPSGEVVSMFINHCPDHNLALSFQLKAPEEWTAAEVQSRLDNYVRKMRQSSVLSHNTACLSIPHQSPVTVNSQPHSSGTQAVPVTHEPSYPMPSVPSAATCQPLFPADMVSVQQPSACPPLTFHVTPPSLPVSGPPPTEPGVQQMVALFDKVLSMCTASLATGPRCPQPAGHSHGHRSPHRASCRVCGSHEHTTHVHCRLYKLCHSCFDPGHMRCECPQLRQKPNMSVPPPTSAALN
ncbi:unnamed protein product [Oreochromis niloticus]|nr:unnamed protein product [Mustela putorius furo]